MLNDNDLKEILNFENENCVSIFIPTQRGGKEVIENKNEKHLNSLWDQTKKELKSKGVDEAIIDKIGKPIEGLIDDKNFWRHQSDGLAVFSSEDFFRSFTLPVNFEAYTHISKEFYVKPLIPAMNGDASFNILSIQLEDVKLFEASKYGITPIEIDDLTPSQLEDRVGYDYKEKALQARTQGEGGEKTQFHGHGGSERDERVETKQFFRAVDQGLKDYLNKEKLPLLVYCQDYLFSIYKDANTYNHMVDKGISGNPNDTDMLEMHQRALEIMEPMMNKTQNEKLERYNEGKGSSHTSTGISDIIPAIFQGKVDTLFIENRAEQWGSYNKEKMEVTLDDEQTSENISLLNLAAKKTLEMGGKVYLVQDAMMPETNSKLNALYRY